MGDENPRYPDGQVSRPAICANFDDKLFVRLAIPLKGNVGGNKSRCFEHYKSQVVMFQQWSHQWVEFLDEPLRIEECSRNEVNNPNEHQENEGAGRFDKKHNFLAAIFVPSLLLDGGFEDFIHRRLDERFSSLFHLFNGRAN